MSGEHRVDPWIEAIGGLPRVMPDASRAEATRRRCGLLLDRKRLPAAGAGEPRRARPDEGWPVGNGEPVNG
ncbi:MAG TPA: hypothetical protein VM364_22395 [Vicinamibacterales bacterium]|nr:hypothetical protein [Vicinamibacterales bacterium]